MKRSDYAKTLNTLSSVAMLLRGLPVADTDYLGGELVKRDGLDELANRICDCVDFLTQYLDEEENDAEEQLCEATE